jgi:hypothetical protein
MLLEAPVGADMDWGDVAGQVFVSRRAFGLVAGGICLLAFAAHGVMALSRAYSRRVGDYGYEGAEDKGG